MTEDICEGMMLHEKYKLIKPLGKGSYATVWMAFCCSNKKFYAIKIHNIDDYNFGKKEVNIYNTLQKKIDKQYIVWMEDTFDEKLHLCEVLELMGYSLYDVLKTYPHGIDFEQLIPISIKILQCIDEFHKNNFIHGDIKPENILLDIYPDNISNIIKSFDLSTLNVTTNTNEIKDDNSTISTQPIEIHSDNSDDDSNNQQLKNINITSITNLKLCDVGYAIVSKKKRKEIQTCYYQSPEVLLGLNYDESVDIWAFGCMFYELLTGNLLFNIDDNTTCNDDRYHIYLMTKNFGMIPKQLIKQSKYKNIFFTSDLTKIKGFDDIPTNETIYDNIRQLNMKKNYKKFIISMFELIFSYNPKLRPTVQELIKMFSEYK